MPDKFNAPSHASACDPSHNTGSLQRVTGCWVYGWVAFFQGSILTECHAELG